MANSQITTRDTQLEKQRLSKNQLSLTNFANTSAPQIAAGSVVELNGSVYLFSSNESISGWSGIANNTDCYIKLTPGASSVTASFTTTAPTWSDTKQGWYNGTDRYVAGLHRGASSALYESKWVYKSVQDSVDAVRVLGSGMLLFSGRKFASASSNHSGATSGMTEDTIFDLVSPLVPNVNDIAACTVHAAADTDTGVGETLAVVHAVAVKRVSATQVDFAGVIYSLTDTPTIAAAFRDFSGHLAAVNGDSTYWPWAGVVGAAVVVSW